MSKNTLGAVTQGHEAVVADVAADASSAEVRSNNAATSSTDPAAKTMAPRLIRNASLRFITRDATKTHQDISKLTQKYQGYIGNETLSRNDSGITQTMVVRIQSNQFDKFLEELTAQTGDLSEKDITIEDVTDQYIDIQARLTNKKALEARYKALLQKANKVADIIEIENAMNTLRSDIDVAEGQLRYLTKQINFSTITISLFQPVYGQSAGGLYLVWEALYNGWRNLWSIGLFALEAWPFILISIGALYGLRRWRQKRQRLKATSTPDCTK